MRTATLARVAGFSLSRFVIVLAMRCIYQDRAKDDREGKMGLSSLSSRSSRSVEARDALRLKTSQWLRQGISPRRLALTLAIGFALGCIPLVGIPTALCAIIALAFRLNQPAIQAANYAAMPLQLILVWPFVRLGRWLAPSVTHPPMDFAALTHSPMSLLNHPPDEVMAQFVILSGQALLAWLLIAIPMVALLTPTLTVLLRRIPALAAAEAGD
jgi:uncharacterized protein (DUF2062 family)